MNNPLIERLRDLEPFSREWVEARDDLAENDREAYRQWLHDMWETDQVLRELKGERRIPDDPAEFAEYMVWWRSEHPEEADDPEDEPGPAFHRLFDEQEAWIRANFGVMAAAEANYGWGSAAVTWPVLEATATKVYGHGILDTVVMDDGHGGFVVTHRFEPFKESPAE